MKKAMGMMMVAGIVVLLTATFSFAEAVSSLSSTSAIAEEKAEAKAEGWKSFGEISAAVHSGLLDDTGALSYDKAVFNQAGTVGLDKSGNGFYFKAENFIPTEGELKETDIYVGFYGEVAGMKVDAGYAHYWVREQGELDYQAVYAAVDFPAICWQVVPFVKAEYRFAKMYEEKGFDDEGNAFINRTDLDGLLYVVGLKREFQVHERIKVVPEISVGGNTGIDGFSAENLSYLRGKLKVSVDLTDQLKLEVSGIGQKNIGHSEGIAAGTDRLFLSIGFTYTW